MLALFCYYSAIPASAAFTSLSDSIPQENSKIKDLLSTQINDGKLTLNL